MFKSLLAIDYGRARIGIASGQMITCTATPIATVKAYNGEPNWIELDNIIKRYNPSDIVIGIPLHEKYSNIDIIKDIHNFAKEVENRYKNNIHFIDESYSTREARWRLEELKDKKFNHIKVDAFAACVILETWMSENKI